MQTCTATGRAPGFDTQRDVEEAVLAPMPERRRHLVAELVDFALAPRVHPPPFPSAFHGKRDRSLTSSRVPNPSCPALLSPHTRKCPSLVRTAVILLPHASIAPASAKTAAQFARCWVSEARVFFWATDLPIYHRATFFGPRVYHRATFFGPRVYHRATGFFGPRVYHRATFFGPPAGRALVAHDVAVGVCGVAARACCVVHAEDN